MKKKITWMQIFLILLLMSVPTAAFATAVTLDLSYPVTIMDDYDEYGNPIQIQGIYMGQTVTASGVADPNVFVTIKVVDSVGSIVFIDSVKSDASGNYSLSFKAPKRSDALVEKSAMTVVAGYSENVANQKLNVFPDIQAPSIAGVTLTASDITSTSVTISWNAATDDVAVTSYRLYEYRGSNLQATFYINDLGVLSYNVTDLTPSTPYNFKVDALDAWGNLSAKTAAKYVTTLVADTQAPTWTGASLTASNITQTGLTLTWTAAADNVGVTNYKVYKDEAELATVSGSTLSYDVSGLTAGTAYSFKVEAGDAANNWSITGPSTPATTLAPPDIQAPTWTDATLTASNITQTGLTLTWTAAADNVGVTNYKVYKNETELATVSGGTLTYNVSGLTAATPYTFKVEAGDAADHWTTNGPSVFATTVEASDNEVPTWTNATLTASNITDKGLTLTWTAAADNVGVTNYKVYKNGAELTTVSGSTLTYNVSELAASTLYTFKIEAVDGAGNLSTTGPGTSATTLEESDTQPPTWTNATLMASDITQTGLTLTWTAAADSKGVTGYKVYKNGTLLTTVGNTLTCDVTGLTSNTLYTFKVEAVDAVGNTSSNGPSKSVSTAAVPVTLSLSKSSAAVGETVTATGSAEKNTWISLKAIDSEGSVVIFDAVMSNAAGSYTNNFVVPDATGVLTIVAGYGTNVASQALTVLDTQAPVWSNPSLTASNVTLTGLTLTWSNATDNVGVTNYKVYKDGLEIASVGGDIFTSNISGLTAGTTYTFKVEAVDAASNISITGPSAAVTTPEAPDTQLPTWTNATLTASNVTQTSLILTWTAAADNKGVTGYKVYKDGIYLDTVSGSTLTYSVSGLTAATAYTFKVEAGDAANNWSINGPGTAVTTLEVPDNQAPTWTSATLTASDISQNSLILTWTAAADNKGVTSYKVYKDGALLTTVPGSTLTYAVTGLTSNTTYSFKVEAVDAAGNLSSNGPSRTVTTAAIAVTISLSKSNAAVGDTVTASGSADQDVWVSLKAIDSEGNVVIFDAVKSDAAGHYTNNFVVPDATGVLTIVAGYGTNVASQSLTVLDTQAPVWSNPSLTASDVTPTTLTLTWSDATDNVGVTNYKVFKNGVEIATVSAETFTSNVSGLTPATAYTFSVEAEDAAGNISTTGPSTAVTTPEVPDTLVPTWTNATLTASNVTQTGLTLTWTAAVDNKEVTHYKLFKDGFLLDTVSGTTLTYSVSGLTAGTAYTFKVEAADAASNLSTNGPTATVTTPAVPDTQAPTWTDASLTVSNVAQAGLTLTWTAATDNKEVTGYKVYKNGNLLTTVSGTTLTCVVNLLTAGTTYTFKVEAVDAAGNLSTNGPDATATTLPSVDAQLPTWTSGSLQASGITDNGLTLAWSGALDNVGVTAFRVYKDGILLATVSGNVSTFDVTGLTAAARYTFKVEAGDAAGNWSTNGPSRTVTTTDTGAPVWGSAASLTASAVAETSLTLTWTAATDSAGVRYYRIYKNGTLLTTVSGTALSYNVTGLTAATAYIFKVEAGDAAGNWSSDGPSLSVAASDTAAPLWRNGILTVTGIGQNSLTLTWNGATDNVGVTGFGIYQNGILLATVAGDTLTYNVTGLTAVTAYTFKVQAVDAAGNWSVNGPGKTVTTLDTEAPAWDGSAALTASAVTKNTLALTWSAATDNTAVKYYRIYKNGSLLATVAGTTLTYSVRSLTANTAYEFKVEAGDAAGNWSANGPAKTVTTPAV